MSRYFYPSVFPWRSSSFAHTLLYTLALCSSSSCCSSSYIKLFLIDSNHPTLTLLHTSGNPNVSGVLAVGTCLEITELTVMICTTTPLCTSCASSFLPGDHDVLSSLRSDGSPVESIRFYIKCRYRNIVHKHL